jgi:predicted RNase H-like HicB family nuclease
MPGTSRSYAGKDLDEVVENLRQALALDLEDEDMASLGLAEHPRMEIIYYATVY